VFRVSVECDSSFLLHVYKDGKGPDKELIEMLERDMVIFNRQ